MSHLYIYRHNNTLLIICDYVYTIKTEQNINLYNPIIINKSIYLIIILSFTLKTDVSL